MELHMLKSPAGSLVPMGDDEAESLRRIRSGAVVRCQISEMRNGKFHRKAFSLLKLCYEQFRENVAPAEYKGRQAAPCFDTWREQFIILAGHYDVTFDIQGKIRLKAKSLSFANCSQEEFEAIYSSLINCALKHAYHGTMTESELRSIVDQVLSYA